MKNLPQTRHSLLLRLNQRSGDAWVEFLALYERAIYDYGRGRGLQDADALDVVQDVLAAVEVRVGGSVGGECESRSFRAWLFRVARNIAVDKFRERTRVAAATGDPKVMEELAQVAAGGEGDGAAFWHQYRRRLVQWAVDQVKPHVNEVTWLCFQRTAVECHRPEDVARELGVSLGNVYTAKCRVIARIRDRVVQLDDERFVDLELPEVVGGLGLPGAGGE